MYRYEPAGKSKVRSNGLRLQVISTTLFLMLKTRKQFDQRSHYRIEEARQHCLLLVIPARIKFSQLTEARRPAPVRQPRPRRPAATILRRLNLQLLRLAESKPIDGHRDRYVVSSAVTRSRVIMMPVTGPCLGLVTWSPYDSASRRWRRRGRDRGSWPCGTGSGGRP